MASVSLDSGLLVRSLKDRYFSMIKKEVIGKTPELTKELDQIEQSIKQIQGKASKVKV